MSKNQSWSDYTPRQKAKWEITQRQKVKDKVKELKSKPCMDCGGVFPYYCMDFDHIHGEKEFTVSKIYRRVNALMLEIAKCELVCANCHRIRTHKRQFGSDNGV